MNNTKLPLVQLSDKTTRRVISYGEDLMMVEFGFKKGGVGEPHSHDEHEQIGYVAQGSFELIVAGEKSIIKKGDTYYAPRKTLHGVVALEDDSILIDAFTPIRKDFL